MKFTKIASNSEKYVQYCLISQYIVFSESKYY